MFLKNAFLMFSILKIGYCLPIILNKNEYFIMYKVQRKKYDYKHKHKTEQTNTHNSVVSAQQPVAIIYHIENGNIFTIIFYGQISNWTCVLVYFVLVSLLQK